MCWCYTDRSMRVLVVLLLAGCWHDVPPPPVMPSTEASNVADYDPPISRRHHAGGPDCSSLGPAMERLFNGTGLQPQMPPIIEAVTTSCIEDGWSIDLIQCFIEANDGQTVEACALPDRGLLSQQQMLSLQNRLMSAITPSVQPPSPPSP